MCVSDFATTLKLGWVTALKMSVAPKGRTAANSAISSTVYVNRRSHKLAVSVRLFSPKLTQLAGQ